MRPRRMPALMEELIEEVLLRFPPDDPASLTHAALICKPWCRLIAGHGFCRRFCEFHHRVAPMLGFVCNVLAMSEDEDGTCNARFVPTSSCLPRPDLCGWHALDCRHGRVLVYTCHWLNTYFAVCKGPAGNAYIFSRYTLGRPALTRQFSVLGAAAGTALCDHLDCQRGPFNVVLVGTYADGDGEQRLFTSVYSSDAGAWSEPTVTHLHPVDNGDSILFVHGVQRLLPLVGTHHSTS